MFDELDDALRRFIIHELPIKNGEIEIAFEQPNRQWSGRLSRPTINLFLYDVRENIKLRQAQLEWENERRGNGGSSKLSEVVVARRRPARVDLHYLISVWTSVVEDEHRLLGRILLMLLRRPELPDELVPPYLRAAGLSATIKAAQYEELTNPSDLWGAMDNLQHPSLTCTVTVAIPLHEYEVPPVRVVETHLGPVSDALHPSGQENFRQSFTIGGTIRSAKPLANPQVSVLERALKVNVQGDGRFTIAALDAGEYTLEIRAEGRTPRRYRVAVPGPDYTLEL